MGSEIWTPEVFFQAPVHLEILVQEMFFGTLTICQILWAKMNHTVQVLRDFVMYHVIWKYKGRTRCVFGGRGINVRPDLPIELSLINLYILYWRVWLSSCIVFRIKSKTFVLSDYSHWLQVDERSAVLRKRPCDRVVKSMNSGSRLPIFESHICKAFGRVSGI